MLDSHPNPALEPMPISDAFTAFLLYDKCGPRISYDTAILLWTYSIMDKKEFIIFSQLCIPRMLIGFPLNELENLRVSDFIRIISYGKLPYA